MGYGSDDRSDNRWRDRGGGGGWRGEGRGGPGRDDDRGFFDRAGDEVRSWFGDDDAQHRREMDERRWERERGMTGRRDNEHGGGSGWSGGGRGWDREGGRGRNEHEAGSYGWMSGGWGNQGGDSWNRERPGRPGGWDRGGSSEREGWTSSSSSSSGGNPRGGGWDQDRSNEREGWFTASEGGERGRRWGGAEGARESGAWSQGRPGGDIHDPHYSEWRRRQIEDLDRDYDEYRREHQSKFESEFGGWRQKRASQRQMLGKVSEHMEVVGSDGSHVGKVDKVRGDRIILAKSDPNAAGMHHSIPCGWVDTVEDKVTLNRTASSAIDSWRNEDTGRALFEREDQGSDGPHALDRSFSGTYGRKDDD